MIFPCFPCFPWQNIDKKCLALYYFYGVDKDFGPFFIKFCSYFPYIGKVCINGNEYLKRQLENKGIAFEPLDNGLRSCANPKRAQRIADDMSAEKIDRFINKWLSILPDLPKLREIGFAANRRLWEVERLR